MAQQQIISEQDRAQLKRTFRKDLKANVNLRLFTRKPSPLTIPGRECPTCLQTQQLMEELSALSPKLRLETIDFYHQADAAKECGVARIPAILLDSVFDRLGEAALFTGLAVYAVQSDFSDDRRLFFILVVFLALIFSQGVSYLRARGEGLGVFTRAGLMTRTERVVLLGVGLLVQQIEWFLLFIAVVSCITLWQRMFAIRDLLNKGG